MQCARVFACLRKAGYISPLRRIPWRIPGARNSTLWPHKCRLRQVDTCQRQVAHPCCLQGSFVGYSFLELDRGGGGKLLPQPCCDIDPHTQPTHTSSHGLCGVCAWPSIQTGQPSPRRWSAAETKGRRASVGRSGQELPGACLSLHTVCGCGSMGGATPGDTLLVGTPSRHPRLCQPPVPRCHPSPLVLSFPCFPSGQHKRCRVLSG